MNLAYLRGSDEFGSLKK